MHVDKFVRAILVISIIGAVVVSVAVIGTLAWRLVDNRRSCAREIESAHAFVETNCHPRSRPTPLERIICHSSNDLLQRYEDERTGATWTWACSWDRVLESYGWCMTSDTCVPTWKFGALRSFSMVMALIIIAYGAIRVLFWIEGVTERRIDDRCHSLPAAEAKKMW